MKLLFVLALTSLAIVGLSAEDKVQARAIPVAVNAKSGVDAKKVYQTAQARDGAHHGHDHHHEHGQEAYSAPVQAVPAYPAPPAVPAYPQQSAQYSPPAPAAYAQPEAPQQYQAAAAPAYPAEAPVYGAGPAAAHQPESYAAVPQQYAPEAHHAPAAYQAPAAQPAYGEAPAAAYSAPSHPGYYYYYYPVQDSGKKKFQWPKLKLPKIPEIGGYGSEFKGLIGVSLAAIILLIVFGAILLALPIIGIGKRSMESVWQSEYLKKDNLSHMASMVLNAVDKYQASIAAEKQD